MNIYLDLCVTDTINVYFKDRDRTVGLKFQYLYFKDNSVTLT